MRELRAWVSFIVIPGFILLGFLARNEMSNGMFAVAAWYLFSNFCTWCTEIWLRVK